MKSSNRAFETSGESQKLQGLWNDMQGSIDHQSNLINDKLEKKSRNQKRVMSIHNAILDPKFPE